MFLILVFLLSISLAAGNLSVSTDNPIPDGWNKQEVVDDLPPVDASLLAIPVEFCKGSSGLPFDLTTYYTAGTTTGGTWTSIGPDATAIFGTLFDPDLPGTYLLTYSVSNDESSDSESIVVTVYPAIDSTIGNITICESPSGTINLFGMLAPSTTPGGTFSIISSTGIASSTLSSSGNQLIYTILPGGTPPYSITIGYTVTGGSATAPCATTNSEANIVITGAISSGFDLPSAWCAEGTLDLNNYTVLGGGEWTLVTVGGAGTIAGNIYTPAPSFTGFVQIDYQPPWGGCGSPTTEFMAVYAQVSAALSVPAVGLCLNSSDLPLDLYSLFLPTTTYGGVWSIEGGSFSIGSLFYPDTNGVYNLLYRVTNGVCADSSMLQITLTEHQLPQFILTAIGSTIAGTFAENQVCSGGELHLTASVSGGEAPFTYFWSGHGITNPNSEELQIAVSAAPGSSLFYTLLLTDSFGCSVMRSVTVAVSGPETCFALNIGTLPDVSPEVNLYPNPSYNGTFFVSTRHLAPESTVCQLMIYNQYGALVWEQALEVREDALHQSLSFSHYTPGLHIVCVRIGTKLYYSKLLLL